jgi:hypothetical protein
MLLLKFIFIWLLVGLLATIASVLYDVFISKIDFKRMKFSSIILMIPLGFVTAVLTTYYTIDDIKINRRFRKNAKK